jgi:antitoxin VapB
MVETMRSVKTKTTAIKSVSRKKPRKSRSLNIKDSEAYELASELANETGESLTRAVKTAVRERLQIVRRRRQSDSMLADFRALNARIAALDKGPYIDHAELLYDENGLPK